MNKLSTKSLGSSKKVTHHYDEDLTDDDIHEIMRSTSGRFARKEHHPPRQSPNIAENEHSKGTFGTFNAQITQ